MKSRPKNPRPKAIDVAADKGDFSLTVDLSRPLTFKNHLFSFITMFEWLGCPNPDVLYRLGAWKRHDRNNRKTAEGLGETEEGIRKSIARLEQTYYRHRDKFIKGNISSKTTPASGPDGESSISSDSEDTI